MHSRGKSQREHTAACSCVLVDATAGGMFVPCLSICVCVCVQVHLLCLLSYTLQQNRLCSNDFLQSVALSLLPSARISPETWRVSTLTDYVYWFRQILDIVPSLRRNGDMVRIAGSYTHTHTRSTALCPGLPRLAGTRKVKPIWILLEQETVSGSGISWAMQVCTSLQTDNHTSTSLHNFFSGRMPFLPPNQQCQST